MEGRRRATACVCDAFFVDTNRRAVLGSGMAGSFRGSKELANELQLCVNCRESLAAINKYMTFDTKSAMIVLFGP